MAIGKPIRPDGHFALLSDQGDRYALKTDHSKSRVNTSWSQQGHRIKIGGLGRMANPVFGANLSFCGTLSHLFTMFVVALVIVNKCNVYVQ